VEIDTEPFREYVRKLEQTRDTIRNQPRQEVNRITDRHLARCKRKTAVGTSPDSPTLRSRWDRSGVRKTGGGYEADVFNPVEYASYYEYGHRQTPGRIIFIELRPGGQKYGIQARQIKNGPNAGKWGIYLRLKKPYVKGSFVMTESEKQAQKELDAAAKRLENMLKKALQ